MLVALAAMWVGCGVLGHAVAVDVEKKRGRSPWAVSPGAWAAICGLTSLLGLIMLLIAGATTKHAPTPPWRFGAGTPIPAATGTGAYSVAAFGAPTPHAATPPAWHPPYVMPNDTQRRAAHPVVTVLAVVGGTFLALVLIALLLLVIIGSKRGGSASDTSPVQPASSASPSAAAWPRLSFAAGNDEPFSTGSALFTAKGTGSQSTPPFSLTRGSVGGGMITRGSGAHFYLVPTASPERRGLLIASSDNAGFGGWDSYRAIPAGTYRLRVEAPANTQWELQLGEDQAKQP